VLETILDDPDYRLVRAESADQALLALVAGQYALLILDIRMPGMTGFELAEIIKQRKKTAQVPIIFLTAYYSEDQHILEGYGSGAVDYLHKPINPQILRSKVAVFAELHRKSRDVEMANRALLVEVAERRNAEDQLRELNETLEQRVAERTEDLRQAGRLKDEFLAMLGHELRNPLAAISNAMQVIHASRDDADRTTRAIVLVDRQSKNLCRIVDDLLDVARVTRGRVDLRKEALDLTQVVRHAVDVIQPMLRGKEELEIMVRAPGALRVHADQTRLEQSLGNVLLNAIKYTQVDRRIKIIVERIGTEAVIAVSDNGIGIAPEMLARIFELFTQADRSLDRAQGGLGIGLFICRQLIGLHGGTISAASEGVGRGAVFSIRLPLLQEATAEEQSLEQYRMAAGGSGTRLGKRVLIVDDNVDSAVTLSWLLADHGYSAHVAHDGMRALQVAQDLRPDILVLDIGLPGIDGHELARRLRAQGFSSALMVAISGYARESDIEASLASGFNVHFAKPVDLDKLMATLAAR
jgi:signal transduction histidine kinase